MGGIEREVGGIERERGRDREGSGKETRGEGGREVLYIFLYTGYQLKLHRH